MATISTELNLEDKMKLTNRAAKLGMTPQQAFRVIATKGVKFFNALLVGATPPRKRK
jgi:hypothetical protein